MSLFKVITDPAPSDPSVLDTDFKKFYPAVQRNMAWDTLLPFVEQAEERFIIPFLGREFFEELETEYNANGVIADVEKAKVFKFVKTSLANYTMFHALPHLNLRIGDAGVTETITQDTTGVRQWTYNASYWSLHENAYQFLDLALGWIEIQIEASNTAFDTFKDSDAYTDAKELLIQNSTILNKYLFINRSRKTYVALKPYIAKAEELHIKPLLGKELYEELKTQVISNTLTVENKALLEPIRNCLTSYMVQLASAQVNFTNRGNAWKVMEVQEQDSANKQGSANSRQELLTKHERLAINFEDEVKDMLYTDLDSYPTFRDSSSNDLADTNETDDWFDEDYNAEAGAAMI